MKKLLIGNQELNPKKDALEEMLGFPVESFILKISQLVLDFTALRYHLLVKIKPCR